MAEREPFNASDPADSMSEMFRRQVTYMALEAHKITLYREMTPQQQLECFVAGALTGIVGVALASVKTEGADAIMGFFTECLPMAREMAESIADENGHPIINHHDALPTAVGGNRE
jgi:hypothetical protein